MRYLSLVSLALAIITLLAGKPVMAGSSADNAQKNREIIAKYYDYYARGDIDGIRSVMAEDVEWHIPGHHPLSGTKKGIDEVVAFFRQLQKAGFKAEVLILAANDDYVIDCHRGWGSNGDSKVDMNWVLLYRIENGKIKKVQNFAGDQHAADAFFWNVYQLKPIPDRLK